jgi:hypothetical protein
MGNCQQPSSRHARQTQRDGPPEVEPADLDVSALETALSNLESLDTSGSNTADGAQRR